MHFFVHKRRSAPAVIIVALVDVLIVLLIFLMVTTTFKQHPSMRLALPESSQAKNAGTSENLVVEVCIDKNGGLSFDQNTNAINLDQLAAKLGDAITNNPQMTLAINADKNAPFYRIVNVMDIVKELKIKSVSASVDTKPAKP